MFHSIRSAFRITAWSSFLAAAVALGLCLAYLPQFLILDSYRPQLIALLADATQARVSVGNVRAELLPYPGLIIDHVALMENAEKPHLLASVQVVHLWISSRALFRGKLQFQSIRFVRPRFIVHRETDRLGHARWVWPAIHKKSPSGQTGGGITSWEFRNGMVDVWDHTTQPSTRYSFEKLTGYYDAQKGKGAASARAPSIGKRCLIDLHYDAADSVPIRAVVGEIEFSSFKRAVSPALAPWFDGKASVVAAIRLTPAIDFHFTVSPLTWTRLPGIPLHAGLFVQDGHFHGEIAAARASSMTLTVDGNWQKEGGALQAVVHAYDPALIHPLYSQRWVDPLEGAGTLQAAATWNALKKHWQCTLDGENFRYRQTVFEIPEWTLQLDERHAALNVQATTRDGGTAQVVWSKALASTDATLEVETSSVTIRQILEVFHLQAPDHSGSGDWNPTGYESLRVDDGHFHSILHARTDASPTPSLEVDEARFTFPSVEAGLTGTFELVPSSGQAHIEGSLENVAVEPLLSHFASGVTPLTGTGRVTYDLDFVLAPSWISHLNGDLDVQLNNGVLRQFKTFYRILSVLNLTNYLRLRLPQVTAQGVEFDSLAGHLNFANGVLSADDLFLASPTMNIGAKGAVDIPGKHLDITIRLEMLRFLEDIIKSVPGVSKIFHVGTKIFLPLVVRAVGPWSDIDIR